MKTHIIYHSADLDGISSAAICLKANPDAVLLPYNYEEGEVMQKIIRTVEPLSRVIMVRVSGIQKSMI